MFHPHGETLFFRVESASAASASTLKPRSNHEPSRRLKWLISRYALSKIVASATKRKGCAAHTMRDLRLMEILSEAGLLEVNRCGSFKKLH